MRNELEVSTRANENRSTKESERIYHFQLGKQHEHSGDDPLPREPEAKATNEWFRTNP